MEEETVKDLIACRSIQEFELKAEIARLDGFTADDFIKIVEELDGTSDFLPVLAEIIRDTDIFDKAFLEKDYYIDYYLTKMEGKEPENPDDFAHMRVLDAFVRNPTASGKNWLDIFDSTVKKLRKLHGDLVSISNFSRIKLGLR